MNHKIIKLDEHSWLIQEGERPAAVYMYLLEGQDSAVLIDTGYGTLPLAGICSTLTDKPIQVILTHGHIDHIGSTAQFDLVYLNEKDQGVYQLHSSHEMRRQFTEETLPPVKKETLPVKEGDIFDLGGRTLEIMETPGHSLGSICILDREHRWLFTGDTCCKAHVLLMMEYSASLAVYRDSVEKLLDRRQEYDIIWPGHHEQPVEKEVLQQFLDAANGILEGRMEGAKARFGEIEAKLLTYKDIGIAYMDE